MLHHLIVPGHCPSKKNHRPIYRMGSRPFLGKSAALRKYEEYCTASLRSQWIGKEPLQGEVMIEMVIRYCGVQPDALGPAETIFDCLETARIISNDRQLVPLRIVRERVEKRTKEEVEMWLRNTDEINK